MDPGDHDQTAAGHDPKRKLAAILHADVAGYSRLMGLDEAGTYARLMADRSRIETIILRHEGRVVGTAGDAVLADFPSVIEALSAAVEIQAKLSEHSAGEPADQALLFRIGINIGDVIVDGTDIFGDGVNVAARVQALAEPGGIAISGAVHDQVRNKLKLRFRPLGTHHVKNIAEPIAIFAIDAADAADAPAAREMAGRRRRARLGGRTALAAVGAVLGVLLALALVVDPFGWFTPSPATGTVATVESGKPTIAVLPFENQSGDPEQDYFSAGITEDVISSLGRFSNLLVLSWNAVAPYAGRSVAPDQLSRDLGARYLVGGSVRRAGDQLRVTVQLTDAGQGLLLWSERYDGEVDSVFSVQDEIVRQVVGALAVRVSRLEQERAIERPTDDMDAYDRVLRGRELLRRIERASNLKARTLFERAREIDPDYADAYVGLAMTHTYDLFYGWSEWPERALERTRELAETAIELDEQSAQGHALLALTLLFQQELGRAVIEIERALDLNPNDPLSLAIQGMIMTSRGEPEEAVVALEQSIRLDPAPVAWWVTNLAESYYLLGRYEDAVLLVERYRQRFYEDPGPLVVLAAAQAQLGQEADAAETADAVRRLSPFFRSEAYVSTFAKPEDRAVFLEGLRRAGLE